MKSGTKRPLVDTNKVVGKILKEARIGFGQRSKAIALSANLTDSSGLSNGDFFV